MIPQIIDFITVFWNFNSKLQFTDSSKVWIPSTLQMSAMGFYKESQSEERLFSVESQHEGA